MASSSSVVSPIAGHHDHDVVALLARVHDRSATCLSFCTSATLLPPYFCTTTPMVGVYQD
jgi:hypothetical protein